ncbi:hypothetical protein CDAR_536741 [Caerostris darwini]|uniref:Uncharacterized protein n=1 Tax=Caerostris darwini TaxID=1538125 RepID=A0AAV4VI85_9ARAC|nr:hypothetical protein CDAR_536741 [Caerostris darwini]
MKAASVEGNSIYTIMDTLSEIAMELINEMDDSGKFLDFILKEVYGKPKPSVLPIVRSYWKDEDDFMLRLSTLTSDLKRRHQEYMEEHRKDTNLIRRIDCLNKNIEREQTEERRRTTRQTTITNYYPTGRN